MSNSLGISVVICAYNSAQRIEKTLEYVSEQQINDLFDWEVVLVDNGSTDSTAAIATKHWNSLRMNNSLRVVNESKQGLSFARQTGVENSNFEYIIFCDDDNYLASDYLRNAYLILEANPTVAALGGKGNVSSEITIPLWFEHYKYCYACYSQGCDEIPLDTSPQSLFGAGLVFRKSVYSKLVRSGFKHILSDRKGSSLISGGDTELTFGFRLSGYLLAYSNTLQFNHFMTANRLKESYLLKLIVSQAYSSAKLTVYSFLLSGKRPGFTHWIKDLVYQFYNLLKALYAYCMKKEMTLLDRQAAIQFAYGKLKGILTEWGSYQHKYDTLIKVYTKHGTDNN